MYIDTCALQVDYIDYIDYIDSCRNVYTREVSLGNNQKPVCVRTPLNQSSQGMTDNTIQHMIWPKATGNYD